MNDNEISSKLLDLERQIDGLSLNESVDSTAGPTLSTTTPPSPRAAMTSTTQVRLFDDYGKWSGLEEDFDNGSSRPQASLTTLR
jgi:hypothetical protein